MEGFVASAPLDNSKSIHIASLARRTIIDAGAEHMGFDGYFIFETDDSLPTHPLTILGKASSLEAAFHIAGLWDKQLRPAV